jgi:hypothetical protein
MKKLLILFVFLFSFDAQAATKVFLHDSASAAASSFTSSWLVKRANSTQGSSLATAVTATIAQSDATFINQFWPDNTASWIITKTSGGTKVFWISDPLSSGVTISGTITPNIYGVESNVGANSGIRYEVFRWNVATGGVSSSLGISTETTEWGNSAAVRTSPTLSPTSTAFNTGDRIMIVIYNTAVGGDQTASSRSMTIDYDAGTGVDGDTYLSFTETISFSADSNNAPARGVSAWRVDRTAIPSSAFLFFR